MTLFAVALASAANAGAHFTGHLAFHPANCDKLRECYLDETFGYVDSQGTGWEAQKNDKTDGASIPSWAQPFIGLPFDPDFIRAAVIHDHYCDRHVRPMLQTHWVFYDALRTSNVSSSKAKIMYAAILIGGPKWIDLIRGRPCKMGSICIQSLSTLRLPVEAYATIADDGHGVVAREAQYDNPDVRAAIEEIKQKIEANPDAVSEDDILAEARDLPENKFFFDHLDGIVINPPSTDAKDR
jgi:hypothetical protein